MTTTRDWRDARRDLLEEGRKRVGPPPDVEKVEALLRGDLPEAEAQHMREVLVYYPELVTVMTASAPPQAEAILTDAQRDTDFDRIRQRLGLPSGVTIQPRHDDRRWSFALAAGLVLALMMAGGIVVMRWNREPRPLTTKVLLADADRTVRGSPSSSAVVLISGTDYLLKPLYRSSRAYREHRLELVDLNTTPPRSVWTRNVKRLPEGSFPAQLSTEDLAPGQYQLVLYGIDTAPERLATYTLWVDTP